VEGLEADLDNPGTFYCLKCWTWFDDNCQVCENTPGGDGTSGGCRGDDSEAEKSEGSLGSVDWQREDTARVGERQRHEAVTLGVLVGAAVAETETVAPSVAALFAAAAAAEAPGKKSPPTSSAIGSHCDMTQSL
jgi:hypothetical protein